MLNRSVKFLLTGAIKRAFIVSYAPRSFVRRDRRELAPPESRAGPGLIEPSFTLGGEPPGPFALSCPLIGKAAIEIAEQIGSRDRVPGGSNVRRSPSPAIRVLSKSPSARLCWMTVRFSKTMTR